MRLLLAQKYRDAEPKFLGTLHERMKFVMENIPRDCTPEFRSLLHDLELEVSYYHTVEPPYASRPASKEEIRYMFTLLAEEMA